MIKYIYYRRNGTAIEINHSIYPEVYFERQKARLEKLGWIVEREESDLEAQLKRIKDEIHS